MKNVATKRKRRGLTLSQVGFNTVDQESYFSVPSNVFLIDFSGVIISKGSIHVVLRVNCTINSDSRARPPGDTHHNILRGTVHTTLAEICLDATHHAEARDSAGEKATLNRKG